MYKLQDKLTDWIITGKVRFSATGARPDLFRKRTRLRGGRGTSEVVVDSLKYPLPRAVRPVFRSGSLN